MAYTQARAIREDATTGENALPPGIAISDYSDSIFYFAGFAGISAALTSAGTATGLPFSGTGFAPYERSILRSSRDFVEVWRCTSDFLVKVIKSPFDDGSCFDFIFVLHERRPFPPQDTSPSSVTEKSKIT
jgi:hypothetical protein